MNNKCSFLNKGCDIYIAVASGLFISLFYLLLALSGNPTPSDEMFYMDAAYKIANGEFTNAVVSHHYYRWVVVLPLALIIKLFGYNFVAIYLWQAFCLLCGAVFLFLSSYRLTKNNYISVIVLFVPLLTPGMSIHLFSEVAAFLMVSSALLMYALMFYGDKVIVRHSYIFAISFFLVNAVNANFINIILLALPGLYLLLYAVFINRKISIIRITKIMLSVIFGAIFSVALIVCIDFMIAGSSLEAFKHMESFHMSSQKAFLISDVFAFNDMNHFILGFAFFLFKINPVFVLFIITSFVLYFINLKNKKINQLDIFILCAFINYLLYEVVSLFVVEKLYYRLSFGAVIPLAFSACIIFYEIIAGSVKSRWRGMKTVANLAFFASFILILIFNIKPNMKSDKWQDYYSEPLNLVYEGISDVRIASQDKYIYSDLKLIPGLMFTHIILQTYLRYKPVIMLNKFDDLSNLKKDGLAWVITESDHTLKYAKTLGFKILPYKGSSKIYLLNNIERAE